MTRNLKLFTGAAIIFYIIGAVNESTSMYVLAAAALAVILAAYFLTRLQIRGVEPRISLRSPRTCAGDPISATIVIANPGAILRTSMSLAIHLENETVPSGSLDHEFLLPPLPPRSRTEVEVALNCRERGVHRLSKVRVIAHDPIGVYHRGRGFESQDGFLALPRTLPTEGLSAWELLSPEGRRSARLLRRTGGEFEGIRPHTPGDDLRQVHWKVTAHAGELVVRQHRPRREAEVTVWIDLWEANHPSKHPDRTETAISLAATLIQLFSRGGYMMSVAGHGLPADLALPSRGESYLDRCLVTLAEARPQAGLTFSDFCEEQIRKSPRLRNVFVVTPSADPGLVDTLGSLRQRGAHVAAFLVGGMDWTERHLMRHFQELEPERGPLDSVFRPLDVLFDLLVLGPSLLNAENREAAAALGVAQEDLQRRLRAAGVCVGLASGRRSMPDALAEVVWETSEGVMAR